MKHVPRVLIADADPNTQEVTRAYFEDEGMAVSVVSRYEDAIKALSGKTPQDMALVDLALPGGTALELLEWARQRNLRTAIVVLAASMDVQEALSALRLGAYDFLLKPFHLSQLAFTAQKALERRRLLLENLAYQRDLERRVEEATADLRKANEALYDTKEYLERLLDSSTDAIFTVDSDFNISYANRGARAMLGDPAETLEGMPVARILARGESEVQELQEYLQIGPVYSHESVLKSLDGTLIPVIASCSYVRDQSGKVRSVVVLCKDITRQKQLEEELKDLSIRDGLTGLYNQRYFQEKLREELERARRQRRPLSMVLLDVDHFKQYNDTYGHLEGDKVLKAIGEVIREHTRGYVDSCFRYGGDEFVVLLPDTDEEQARGVGERIRAAFAARKFGECTLSVGVISCRDEISAECFFARADQIMYDAKRAGGNRVYSIR
ncbi:MAG TPA: diguanylate cyclase [Candidatus Hydrogenedentes bacterium]|nr:diguanylate cyclase [Candidatus Hydrogenedentota bacterium]HOK88785.1 diguanylate cyclase [Candidatus Hydrogenedentota bacterium]